MLWYADSPEASFDTMQDILPLIRFPLMSPGELEVAALSVLSMHPGDAQKGCLSRGNNQNVKVTQMLS